MSTNCINPKNAEFIALQQEAGIHPAVLAGRIGVWMDKNTNERYPTLEELGLSPRTPVAPVNSEPIRSNTISLDDKSRPAYKKAKLLYPSGKIKLFNAKERDEYLKKYNTPESKYNFNVGYQGEYEIVKGGPKESKYRIFLAEKPKLMTGKAKLAAIVAEPSEFTAQNASESDSKAYPSDEVAMFNDFMPESVKMSNRATQRAYRMSYEMAVKMNKRFGIKFKTDSYENINRLFPGKIKLFDAALFDAPSKTSFFVTENFTPASTIHEMFMHPFLLSIQDNPSYMGLYDSLLATARSNERLVKSVENDYGSDYKFLDYEIITRYMDILVESKLKTRSVLSVLKGFTAYIAESFCIEFGLNIIKPTATFEQIADYLMFGRGTMSLAYGEQADKIRHDLENDIPNRDVREWQGMFNAPSKELMKASILEEIDSTKPVDTLSRDLGFNEIFLSRYSTYQNHNDTNTKFEEIRNMLSIGLRSQLEVLRVSGNMSKQKRDAADKLLRTIENDTNEATILTSYLKYADNEMIGVRNALNAMIEIKKNNGYIDSDALNVTKAAFMDLHEKARQAISTLLTSDNEAINKFSRNDREYFENLLNSLLTALGSAKSMFASLDKYAYGYLLREEGARVGDKSMTHVVAESLYSVDEDSGFFFSLIGLPSKSKIAQTKAMVNIVTRANETAVAKFQLDEDVAEMAKIVSRMKSGFKKFKFTSFAPIYELDDNGKRVGYMNSDLKHGLFLKRKDEFLRNLEKEYGIKERGAKPEKREEREEYEEKINKYLEVHAERMFTAAYYTHRNKLSEAARGVLDTCNIELRNILDKYKNKETGEFELEKMSNTDYSSMIMTKLTKKNLANKINENGEYKTGIELEIAEEIATFNENIKGKINYEVNKSGFDAKYAEIKRTKTKQEAEEWYRRNTRKVIDQSFYDDMEILSDEFTEKYKDDPAFEPLVEAKQRRSSFLKRFRHPDTNVVLTSIMSENDLRTIKSMDEEVSEWYKELEKVDDLIDDFKFDEFARSYTSPAFDAALAKATAISKDEREAFLEANTITIFKNGQLSRKATSAWTIVEPLSDEMITYEPNFAWSSINKTSEFYNNKYNPDIAENGYQPNAKLYDNSAAMRKIRADKNLSDLYDIVLKLNAKSNSKYSYMKNPSAYRIAQVQGGLDEKIAAADGFFKFIWSYLLDSFTIEKDDVDYGFEYSGHNNPDGSKIRFIKTAFKSMLRNPAEISSNLPMITAAMYAKALQFEELSSIKGDAELIKRGIANTRVNNYDSRDAIYTGTIDEINAQIDKANELKQGNAGLFTKTFTSLGNKLRAVSGTPRDVIADGKTNMYSIASKFADQHLYGEKFSSSGKVSSRFNRQFNIDKMLRGGLRWMSAVNLVGNVPVIMGNYIGAMVALNVEAASGHAISHKALLRANKECFLRTGELLNTIINPTSDNKIMATMALMGVSSSPVNKFDRAYGMSAFNVGSLSDIAYLPYTMGDFVVKSQLTVGYLMEHKLIDGKFVSRAQFFADLDGKDRWRGPVRKARMALWNNAKENLYDALEFDKGINVLKIKDKYKSIISEEELAAIGRRLDRIAKKTDGAITVYDKTTASKTVLGSALTMHRGFLIMALSDRWHAPSYSYEAGEFQEGMYLSALRPLLYQFLEKIGKTIPDAEKEMRNSSYRAYNQKRLLNEAIAMMTFAVLSVVLSNIKYDEDERERRTKDKDKDLIDYAYLASVRALFEMNSVYGPWDTFGVLKDPFAGQSVFSNTIDFVSLIGNPDEAKRITESGPYEGRTVAYKHFMKSTPARATYELLNSNSFDPKTDNMLKTVGIFHWMAEVIIGSKERDKRKAKLEKKRKKDEKEGKVVRNFFLPQD